MTGDKTETLKGHDRSRFVSWSTILSTSVVLAFLRSNFHDESRESSIHGVNLIEILQELSLSRARLSQAPHLSIRNRIESLPVFLIMVSITTEWKKRERKKNRKENCKIVPYSWKKFVKYLDDFVFRWWLEREKVLEICCTGLCEFHPLLIQTKNLAILRPERHIPSFSNNIQSGRQNAYGRKSFSLSVHPCPIPIHLALCFFPLKVTKLLSPPFLFQIQFSAAVTLHFSLLRGGFIVLPTPSRISRTLRQPKHCAK